MGSFIPNPLFVQEILHGPVLDNSLQEIAEEGLRIGLSLVARDTGELADSMHVEDNPDGPGKRIVAGTDHWLYPEFGTSDMPAQPYLGPIPDALGLHK